EDYEKFIDICKNELKDNYFLQTWDTDKGFGLPITKIRKNNTIYREKNSANTNAHNGIFIDIFPFDSVPDNKIKQLIQGVNSFILKRLILSELGYEFWTENQIIKRVIYKLVDIIGNLIPLEKKKTSLEKQM